MAAALRMLEEGRERGFACSCGGGWTRFSPVIGAPCNFFLRLEKPWAEMVSAGSETLFFFDQIT